MKMIAEYIEHALSFERMAARLEERPWPREIPLSEFLAFLIASVKFAEVIAIALA